jgi:hypothetical protein
MCLFLYVLALSHFTVMNRWDNIQYTQIAEAEFLDEIGKKVLKVSSLLLTGTSLRILPPSPPEQKWSETDL